MKNMIIRFVKDEQGQDLIEYTLLMAFIALASAAIFINVQIGAVDYNYRAIGVHRGMSIAVYSSRVVPTRNQQTA